MDIYSLTSANHFHTAGQLLAATLGARPPSADGSIATDKRCTLCNQTKSLSAFHKARPARDGLHPHCKACRAADRKRRYPHEQAKRAASYIKRRYGITPTKYESMLRSQGGRCAICGGFPRGGRGDKLYVDHCHESRRTRGLLCHNCNSAIGYFEDNTVRMLLAIGYLYKYRD